jgi:hypothetical protein
MKRHLNSTGRIKIKAEQIAIRLIDEEGKVSRFEANLSGLTALGLDHDARVVVEAFAKTSSMRFDFGTIGVIQPPIDTSLSEIDRGAGVLFRIKVIDVHQVAGRLLAASGTVRPRDESDEEEDRRALLPLREVDLGEKIWELELSDRPSLLVNRAVPEIAQRLAFDPLLQGAIFPVVLRDVMREIVTGSASEDDEWVVDWLAFASVLLGEPVSSEVGEEDADELINRIVDAFNKQQKWVSKAKAPVNVPEPMYD